MKTKIDTSGLTKGEIRNLCIYEQYSKSTYYRILKRGWMYVEIESIFSSELVIEI